MDPAKPESVGPPKAKWITIRGDPLPWRDWRFWAHLAAVIPIAFACILLMWLYLLSFAIFPNGLVVYCAAVLHLVAVVWTVRVSALDLKEARQRRKQGLPIEHRYVRRVAMVAACLSFTAVVNPIVFLWIMRPLPSTDWVKLANGFLRHELGF